MKWVFHFFFVTLLHRNDANRLNVNVKRTFLLFFRTCQNFGIFVEDKIFFFALGVIGKFLQAPNVGKTFLGFEASVRPSL